MSQDRYPPLPPLSPQDRAYAEVVVTQPWQPVPQIQTQEANAARIAALEAEIARLRAGIATLAGLRFWHDENCCVYNQLACDCGADAAQARLDVLVRESR